MWMKNSSKKIFHVLFHVFQNDRANQASKLYIFKNIFDRISKYEIEYQYYQ